MTKAVSNENLERFKAKCDETYAKVGEGGITLSQVIAREETLPTATADSPDFVQTPDGTLYRKKAVEGGSLLGSWRWNDTIDPITNTFNFSFTSNNTQYIGINVYPEGRGIHVEYLKSGGEIDNASTGHPTVSDEYRNIDITDISALTNEADFTSWFTLNATQTSSGGASVSYEYVAQQDIPTPTTADNGKVLGVANGAYALQAEGGSGGTQLYCHRLQFDGDSNFYHVINNSNASIETLQDLINNQLYIVGRLNVDTSFYPVLGYFSGVLVYITFTGGWTGVTGANFATKDVASGTSITDIVVQL